MYLAPTAARFGHRLLQSVWVQAACIAVFTFAVYLATSENFTTVYDHYVRLADAFLNGRVYLVDAPDWLELARYGDKAFVISAPAPTLFVLPWVAIWGTGVNQALICWLVAGGAVGLFWVATARLNWDLRFRIAITALFAFGTNFWWAASAGSVWTMAHVSAVFFLMAAFVETTGKNRPWLIGILVGLAGLSRLPTFLTIPFFAYTVSRGTDDRRRLVLRLLLLCLFAGIMGGLYLLYTYLEYGSLNMGYEHGQFVQEPWFSEGLFDISYIPRQINAILFYVPVFSEEFPYFKPSFMGLGLFLTTPALLYMFRARMDRMNLYVLSALLLTAIPLITYGATGWLQFGYRFSLDIVLFMLILAASGMHYRLDRPKIAAIALCCAINLWGVLSFHKLDWIA